MTHKCPVTDCKAIVGGARLMCPTHWYMVPGKLQNAVYHWNRQAPRSEHHFAAMLAAVDAVNASYHTHSTRERN